MKTMVRTAVAISVAAAAMGCSPARHAFAACPTCADEYDATGTITPEHYAAHAERWVSHGATVVGGCCGIGPAHLRAVAERLRGAEGSVGRCVDS